MEDPQRTADILRELVADENVIHRLGIEILRAEADGDQVTLRARHRHRIVALHRGAGWRTRPLPELSRELAGELAAEALSPSMAGPMARPSRAPLPSPSF